MFLFVEETHILAPFSNAWPPGVNFNMGEEHRIIALEWHPILEVFLILTLRRPLEFEPTERYFFHFNPETNTLTGIS